MATKVAKVVVFDGEPLTALCAKCACCLASGTHCFECHANNPIEKLCGCGTCKAQIDDYVDRAKILKVSRQRLIAILNENRKAARASA